MKEIGNKSKRQELIKTLVPPMKDRYLDKDQRFYRLLSDYIKHKKIIVAFDLDNTIFDYHDVGDTYPKLIKILKQCQDVGFELVCFTATDNISNIANTLHPYNILDYSINASSVKSATTKPYYNILLDDRAGLKSAYKTLKKLLKQVPRKKRKLNE